MPSSLQERDYDDEMKQGPLTQDSSLLGEMTRVPLNLDPKFLAVEEQEQKGEQDEEQDEEQDDDDDAKTVEMEAEEELDGSQEEEEEASDLQFSTNMRWDCVEWWCHAILQQFSEDMIENLESLLKGQDLPTRGRFYTRLRAAAFWQDILDLTDDNGTWNWNSIHEKLQALHATFLLADANAWIPLDTNTATQTQTSSLSLPDDTKNWPIFQKDYEDALRFIKVHEQFGKFERLLKVSNESSEDLEAIVARFETELKEMFDGQVPKELVSFLKVNDGEDPHALKPVWHDHLQTMLNNRNHEFSTASLVNKLQQLVQSWCDQSLTAPKLVRLGYSCMEDPTSTTLEDVHVAVHQTPAALAVKKRSKNSSTPILKGREESSDDDDSDTWDPKPAALAVKPSSKSSHSSPLKWREESSDDDDSSDMEDDDTWDPRGAAEKFKAKASVVEAQEYLDPVTNRVVPVPPLAAAARSHTAGPLRRSTRKLPRDKQEQKTAQKTNENNLSFNESSDEETDLEDAPPPRKRRRVIGRVVPLRGQSCEASSSDEDDNDDENSALPTPVRSRGRSLSVRARVSLSTNASPHARARSAPPPRKRKRKRRLSAPKTYQGRRRFTADESEAIKEGIAIYGKGKWVEIKELAGDRLLDRSTVQIKDRYRSMIDLGEILRFTYNM